MYMVHKYCIRHCTTKEVYMSCNKKQNNVVSFSNSDNFLDPVKCYTTTHKVGKDSFYFLYMKISLMSIDTLLFWNTFHLRQILRYILVFL